VKGRGDSHALAGMEVDGVAGWTGRISAWTWLTAQQGGSGYLVPDAGHVAEGFGDDQPRVV
jgi:hypothetical protein